MRLVLQVITHAALGSVLLFEKPQIWVHVYLVNSIVSVVYDLRREQYWCLSALKDLKVAFPLAKLLFPLFVLLFVKDSFLCYVFHTNHLLSMGFGVSIWFCSSSVSASFLVWISGINSKNWLEGMIFVAASMCWLEDILGIWFAVVVSLLHIIPVLVYQWRI